jgi:integrase
LRLGKTLGNHRRTEGVSNATILSELSTLSQTIKMMKKLKYEIPEVDFAELKKDNRVRPAKSRVRWLSAAEEREFLRQLHPDTYVHGAMRAEALAARQDGYDLAVMYLNLGPRYNEFASLEWEHVDLQKRVIYLYRTKTDNESTLDMPEVVFEVLTRRFENKRHGQKYVFEDSTQETHRKYAPGVFNSAFRRANIRGASIHTMRHTYAAKFIQNGGTLYELQQQLGHSSSSKTQIYAHLAPNQGSARSKAIMDRLNT